MFSKISIPAYIGHLTILMSDYDLLQTGTLNISGMVKSETYALISLQISSVNSTCLMPVYFTEKIASESLHGISNLK